ncbi:hypothetical protein CMV_001475 [Castanea mollissima]|uniref:Reverse transcriptase zinc-binding domain-containing protein n=1 Tax=Castanea mollissima TaxID=60419 RepID=A0A8J4RXL7_9ROSI|nr:hypothetical protein CMV_001475 [Castanea mollissima]
MPKIKCFMWQCVHRSILVREVLVAKGLNLYTSCPLCNDPTESIIHVLRDCPIAQQVWNSLSPPMLPNLFFGANLLDWLCLNYTANHSTLVLWASEYAFLGVNENKKRSLGTIFIKWETPPQHWHKLNIDGSSLGNLGRAVGRDIIRNSNGEWMGGYAQIIGTTTSVAVELWALRDGLNMCIDLNLLVVIIELDAKLVVDLLKNMSGSLNGNDDSKIINTVNFGNYSYSQHTMTRSRFSLPLFLKFDPILNNTDSTALGFQISLFSLEGVMLL